MVILPSATASSRPRTFAAGFEALGAVGGQRLGNVLASLGCGEKFSVAGYGHDDRLWLALAPTKTGSAPEAWTRFRASARPARNSRNSRNDSTSGSCMGSCSSLSPRLCQDSLTVVSQRWQDGLEAWRRLVGRARTGEDALNALSDIGLVRRLMDQAELDAVRDARRARKSWAEIATRLGVSRQSAWERWRELDEEPALPAMDQAMREAAEELVTARSVVTVPDVVGMSWAGAQHRLLEECLHAVSADPQLLPLLGSEAADYRVVEQKPAAGDRVAPESPVTVWLHRGPGSADVRAPLNPPPSPRVRRGALDEETGDSVR